VNLLACALVLVAGALVCAIVGARSSSGLSVDSPFRVLTVTDTLGRPVPTYVKQLPDRTYVVMDERTWRRESLAWEGQSRS
jgi:hypothetical protein